MASEDTACKEEVVVEALGLGMTCAAGVDTLQAMGRGGTVRAAGFVVVVAGVVAVGAPVVGTCASCSDKDGVDVVAVAAAVVGVVCVAVVAYNSSEEWMTAALCLLLELLLFLGYMDSQRISFPF